MKCKEPKLRFTIYDGLKKLLITSRSNQFSVNNVHHFFLFHSLILEVKYIVGTCLERSLAQTTCLRKILEPSISFYEIHPYPTRMNLTKKIFFEILLSMGKPLFSIFV